MSHTIIHTDKAPEAIGPYSQGIISQGFLFTSGQAALDPASGNLVGTEISTQTHQTLKNLQAVLHKAGCDFKDVVKTLVFLTSMDDFPVFNKVYSQYLKDHRPARSTVAVAALPKGACVEVEMIAKLPE